MKRRIAKLNVQRHGPLTPEEMVEVSDYKGIPPMDANDWKSVMSVCSDLVVDDSGRYHLKEGGGEKRRF